MLPAPIHVNQLTAGTRFPNGTPSGAYDCSVACGRMAIDAYTGGKIVPSTTEFRSKQRDQDGPGALSPGIGLDDIAEAWRAYGLTFEHGGRSWTAIMDRLRAGDGLVVQGQYKALGDLRAPGSRFEGGHAMYLQRLAPRSAIVVNDPLRAGVTVIPADAVRRFYTSGLAQAGWGRGVYAGAGAGHTGGGTWGDPALGAQLRAILAGMGLTDPAHRITAAEAQEIGRQLGNVNLGHDLNGRTVGEILATADAKLELPDIPGAIAGAAAQLGDAIGDAAIGLTVNVAVLAAIGVLGYLGLKNILTAPAAIVR